MNAPLIARSRPMAAGIVIEVIGELDPATVPVLREALMEAARIDGPSAVIVDLRRVDFIDSSGKGLLVQAYKQLASTSRLLHILIAPGRQPERVLRLGGFDKIIPLTYEPETLYAPVR